MFHDIQRIITKIFSKDIYLRLRCNEFKFVRSIRPFSTSLRSTSPMFNISLCILLIFLLIVVITLILILLSLSHVKVIGLLFNFIIL